MVGGRWLLFSHPALLSGCPCVRASEVAFPEHGSCTPCGLNIKHILPLFPAVAAHLLVEEVGRLGVPCSSSPHQKLRIFTFRGSGRENILYSLQVQMRSTSLPSPGAVWDFFSPWWSFPPIFQWYKTLAVFKESREWRSLLGPPAASPILQGTLVSACRLHVQPVGAVGKELECKLIFLSPRLFQTLATGYL